MWSITFTDKAHNYWMTKRLVNEGLLKDVLKHYIFPSENILAETLLLKLIEYWLNVDIEYNARKLANIKNPHTGRALELDIWIPNHQICFEFQVCTFLLFFSYKNKDEYHYASIWYTPLALDQVQLKDSIISFNFPSFFYLFRYQER